MILPGRSNDSFMGRINVRVKLAIGICMSVVAVVVDSFVFLAGLTILSSVIFLSSRPNTIQIKLVAVLCLLLVWGGMLSQAIFYNHFPRDILFTIFEPNFIFSDGLHLYIQGIHHGAIQSFRMVSLLLTGYAICCSTNDDQFLRGFVALKVPFSISFMAVSAIQFVPVAVAEYKQVRTAMRLKGYLPFQSAIPLMLKIELGGLGTMLAGTIRRSEEKAISILTRGFDVTGVRSSYYEDTLCVKEKIALILLLVIVAVIVIIRLLFWFYQTQLFYLPALRGIYGFARDWL